MNDLFVGAILAASAVLSAAMIVMLLPMLRRHALAQPNARSSHRKPTPQGGGIAVIAATVVVAGVALAWLQTPPWLVLAATAGLAAVGAIDDMRTVGVLPRLAFQAMAVIVVLASLPADLRVAPSVPWWIERALLAVACLWFVNLTNFMDGIDWMTVAEFVPLTVALAALGLLGALPDQGMVVALALCGALIGFAPFNRPVARLFLGDVGSLPLGLLVAWLLILLAAHGHAAAALILPLYYLADATITLMRRALNREPVWQAHRTHFYQRATDRGLSVTEIVTRVFAVNSVLGMLAVATVLSPWRWSAAAALACAAALVTVLLAAFVRGKS